jgi:1,4-dihydroxy-2-naphthoate octaprenyltransferase
VQIQKSKISSQRWSAFIFAGVAVLLFALHIGADNWILALAGVGFFLGITDFGRQCPLLLSVHHLLARLRKKS